jgi:hypothetical protein
MATLNEQVQEMQGLYGPFTIAERVVQKIWLRRDFALERAVLADGRKLEIRSPGTWNLLGGPDFRGARLEMDGREISGDIEIHFHAADWRAHGHDTDRAYDNVVLHVVMFPLAVGEGGVRRRDQGEIPTLVLLPLLHRSLEEYASDDALENITERDMTGRIAELLRMPGGELRQLLQRQAAARWTIKVHFASLRIRQLGWTAAAHQTALEILGYRHNRAPMLSLAGRHSLDEWIHGLDIGEIFREREGQWQLQGVRPANHPHLRLRQYQLWVSRQPDWPTVLHEFILGSSPDVIYASPTALVRKQAGLSGLRERIGTQILGNVIGGSRLDTLICDGLLPLAAARTGNELLPVWFHWFLGDVPKEVRRALRETGIAGRGAPQLCHGWGQGLLGWMLEREARASG